MGKLNVIRIAGDGKNDAITILGIKRYTTSYKMIVQDNHGIIKPVDKLSDKFIVANSMYSKNVEKFTVSQESYNNEDIVVFRDNDAEDTHNKSESGWNPTMLRFINRIGVVKSYDSRRGCYNVFFGSPTENTFEKVNWLIKPTCLEKVNSNVGIINQPR